MRRLRPAVQLAEKRNNLKFGNNVKTLIFVPSTSLIRGPQMLALHKAGFFYFPATGIVFHISSGLPLPSAKKRTARESGLVDSGIRRAAFLSACNVNKSHYAHRNYNTVRGENAFSAAPSFPSQANRTRAPKAAFKGTVATEAGLRNAGYSTGKPSLIHLFSVI